MTDKQIDILVNAWKMYQDLSKGFGENCWKIRSLGIGFWSAVIGYGYKEHDNKVYLFSILILLIFFWMESGIRRLQYKYIEKSIEVEKSINDFLVGGEPDLPDKGISTNIDTPNVRDLFNLFQLKRWMFWFPYLVLLLVSILFTAKFF